MSAVWRWRRDPVTVEYTTAPADVVPVDEQRRIDELDVMVFLAAAAGDWPRVDRLLDMRNAIRPARVASPAQVPVIPGRSM